MTAPLSEHQLAAGEIYHQLKSCAEEHEMSCIPAIAPFDVQLDKDEKTMLQPDVMIACDEELLQRRGIYGAPEFVLEVLSPSTRAKDQVIKLKKYQEAGCEEYWIVDIENRRVLVYLFKNENWPDIYSFDDRVPVGISEGLCEIDFTKVEKEIARVQGIKE
jgi:Uma2 family endonuclease